MQYAFISLIHLIIIMNDEYIALNLPVKHLGDTLIEIIAMIAQHCDCAEAIAQLLKTLEASERHHLMLLAFQNAKQAFRKKFSHMGFFLNPHLW